jgi:hypothetical protein
MNSAKLMLTFRAYEYAELQQPNSIRLLWIYGDVDDAPLRAELRETSIKEKQPYFSRHYGYEKGNKFEQLQLRTV